jgi:hypothetical protein
MAGAASDGRILTLTLRAVSRKLDRLLEALDPKREGGAKLPLVPRNE